MDAYTFAYNHAKKGWGFGSIRLQYRQSIDWKPLTRTMLRNLADGFADGKAATGQGTLLTGI